MLQCGDDWSIRGTKQDSKKLENKELHQLVAASSTSAFRCLGGDVEMLTQDPVSWSERPVFRKAKSAEPEEGPRVPPGRGGGGSRMLRGLMLGRRAVLGTPKFKKSVGHGALPRTPLGERSDPLAGGEGGQAQ